jgi:hypothetical protein
VFGGLVLAAITYVRVTWWLARGSPSRLLVTWLGATAICALAAAAVRGPSSAERLLGHPFTARTEAALLTSILALPAFGMATLSVRRRLPRRASAQPSGEDIAAGVLACLTGAGALLAVLIVLTLLLVP